MYFLTLNPKFKVCHWYKNFWWAKLSWTCDSHSESEVSENPLFQKITSIYPNKLCVRELIFGKTCSETQGHPETFDSPCSRIPRNLIRVKCSPFFISIIVLVVLWPASYWTKFSSDLIDKLTPNLNRASTKVDHCSLRTPKICTNHLVSI